MTARDGTSAATPARVPQNGWTGGHYSLWRAALGLLIACWVWNDLAGCLHGTGFLGEEASGNAGHSLAEGLRQVFAAHGDAPRVLLLVLVTWICAALLLAVGKWDRAAAIYLAACALALTFAPGVFGSMLTFLLPWTLCLPLVLHACTPAAPYGSLAARGRPSPGGDWKMSDGLRLAVWIVGVLPQLQLAILIASRIGQRESRSIAEEAADDPALVRLFGESGAVPAASALLVLLLVTACIALLGPWPRARGAAWCALFVQWLANTTIECARAAEPGALDLSARMQFLWLPLLVLLFDPAWIRARGDGARERLFYDGACGLCQRGIRFVLAEDRSYRPFRFAPLAGETFSRSVPEHTRAQLPDSVVVQRQDGTLLVRSDAAIHVLERLGGLWRVLGTSMRIVPRPVRDLAYDLVARVRLRLFARPKSACPLGPPEITRRFDP